jgi:hypothetical protein
MHINLRTSGRRLAGALATLVIVVTAAVAAQAMPPDPFAICAKQRYALCATASCLVYNGVAYCKCDVKAGKSISEAFTFDGRDICDVNKQGYGNGYMMSTYSLPAGVVAGGNQAIYTCPGASSDGAYAQCDGGFCFASTRGRRFPGFDRRLTGREIMCSCPITVADPGSATVGYQIVGPYPCQQAFFDNCDSSAANTATGSTVYVGAPTGSPRVLTELLNGSVPKLNHCEQR